MQQQTNIISRPTFVVNDSFKRSKEFVKSPFRYPGGKFYALKHIFPFISCVPHDEYREPFVGGGTVFFAKPKSQYNWINDLETDIIHTYNVMQDQGLRLELNEKISKEVATKERHSEVKQLPAKSDLEIAFKTFYLNRTSYSGIIQTPAWGYAEGKSSPPQNWASFIINAGEKLQGVNITNLDFEEVVNGPSKGNQVLMYLDPPYYHADQKRAYTKPFTLGDHTRLANVLRNSKHLFCLSYDDCKEVRELYSWAEIYELTWLYNTANKKGESRSLGNELIITNYTVKRPSQPYFNY